MLAGLGIVVGLLRSAQSALGCSPPASDWSNRRGSGVGGRGASGLEAVGAIFG